MNIVDKPLNKQYQTIHQKKIYGQSSHRLFPFIAALIKKRKKDIILDFGGGQSNVVFKLAKRFSVKGIKYDPAIPEFSKLTVDNADIVINTDVLEHIPEDILDNVLEKISAISQNVFFNIHMGLAKEILPNGENAHCTVYPAKWWRARLKKHFNNVVEVYSPARNSCAFVTRQPNFRSLIDYQIQRVNCYSILAFLNQNMPSLYYALRSVYRLFIKRT